MMITISNRHQGNAAHQAATTLRELSRELALAPTQGAPGSVSHSVHAATVSRLRSEASDAIEQLALRLDGQERAQALAARDALPGMSVTELRGTAAAWDTAAQDWD